MTRTTRFIILVVLQLPTLGSNFATLPVDKKEMLNEKLQNYVLSFLIDSTSWCRICDAFIILIILPAFEISIFLPHVLHEAKILKLKEIIKLS